MADKTVVFKISPDGSTVDVDATGFVGGGCKDFAKLTMDALGQVLVEKKKDDFYSQIGSGISVGSR